MGPLCVCYATSLENQRVKQALHMSKLGGTHTCPLSTVPILQRRPQTAIGRRGGVARESSVELSAQGARASAERRPHICESMCAVFGCHDVVAGRLPRRSFKVDSVRTALVPRHFSSAAARGEIAVRHIGPRGRLAARHRVHQAENRSGATVMHCSTIDARLKNLEILYAWADRQQGGRIADKSQRVQGYADKGRPQMLC